MNAGKTLLMLAFLTFSASVFSQPLVLVNSKGKTATIKPRSLVEIEVETSKIRETWKGQLLRGGKDSARLVLYSHEILESRTDSSSTFRIEQFEHHVNWHTANIPIQNWRSVEFESRTRKGLRGAGLVLGCFGPLQALVLAPLLSFEKGKFDKKRYKHLSKSGWIAWPLGMVLYLTINPKTIDRY